MYSRIRSAFCTLALSVLAACGGGGDSPAPISTSSVQAPVLQSAPVANAGVDQSVFVSSIVTVDGGASSDANGDTLSYKWTLLSRPAGSGAALSSVTSTRSTFVADVAGQYVVGLIVNDGKIDSAQDTATITASVKVVPPNAVPTANAGPNQVVPVSSYVSLSASASSDPEGSPLLYQWGIVSSPAGSMAALTDSKVVNPRFFADKAGTYSVLLLVSDGKEISAPSTVIINAVEPATSSNTAPVANAGADQLVTVKTTVFLDGTQSRDPNGDPLTYSWSFSSKPITSYAALTGTTTSKPQFVADVTGIYEISLSVSDGKSTSLVADKITIVAKDATVTPIADTGTYRCASLTKESAAYLYSIGHTYLDRDHDGRPCEANDLTNELANPYVAPPPSNSGQCYVRGYYRSNGTYVSGYWRRCPT
jgi:hypothetical protein